MPLKGTLRSWDDDRGFGFIAPSRGGAELFVHITAFPRDGSRPTIGERLTYEVERGKNGRPQATKVYRQAAERSPQQVHIHGHRPAGLRLAVRVLIVCLLLLVVASFAYRRLRQPGAAVPHSAQPEAARPAVAPSFSCDGRTHCSQMTSCAEAKYFLKNCPDTRMDGNNDGVPCEQQWCTSFLAE